MNRRDFLKWIGITAIAPSVSILTPSMAPSEIGGETDKWKHCPMVPTSIGYTIPKRSQVGDIVTVTIGQGPDRKDLGKFRITKIVSVGGDMFKTTAEWIKPEDTEPLAFDVTFAYENIPTISHRYIDNKETQNESDQSHSDRDV